MFHASFFLQRTVQKRTGKYAGSSYTFIEAVPEYLCCSRCKPLLVLPENPHRVNSRLYCAPCVKKEGMESQSKFDRESEQQILKLEIICPNSAEGCQWQGQLGEVESHRSMCPKEMIPCQFIDIGCNEMMLRDATDEHQEKNKDKHLHCATLTINEMKRTDVAIRKQMQDLEEECRERIEELKKKYEGIIQRLREEISPCPPVVVRMINWWDKSDTLSLRDLFCHYTYVSSAFFSHPQGYKLCIILKCSGSDDKVKVKIVALHQETDPKRWPCKGVAVISLQPEFMDPYSFEIEFIIKEPTLIDRKKLGEEDFKICLIPKSWRETQKPTSMTLKVNSVELQ